MVEEKKRFRIAVIGAGISGLTAAYLLAREHEVEIFEKEPQIGGHTNTIVVPDKAGSAVPIDTGFIVCNRSNYPNFYKLLSLLKIELQDSEMSFGYSCSRTGIKYIGPGINEFLRTPENIFKPTIVKLILEQRRFNRCAISDLESKAFREIPLRQYVDRIGISELLWQHYLVPLVGSIWSSPDTDIDNFPARTLVQFFKNHGMLELHKRPQWQTVVGGSHAYLKSFIDSFKGEIHTDSSVVSVTRNQDKIAVALDSQETLLFDKVVVATHADQALQLLKDATEQERSILSTWRYNSNRAVLHTDSSIMQKPKRYWASWNFHRSEESANNSGLAVTYYMNRLQGLRTDRDYFVSLNPSLHLDQSKIIYQTEYTHPVYTPQVIENQIRLRFLNGKRGTFYCGAHLGYGFHEDGVNSALEVAKSFGISL